jgi:hypothetical protein
MLSIIHKKLGRTYRPEALGYLLRLIKKNGEGIAFLMHSPTKSLGGILIWIQGRVISGNPYPADALRDKLARQRQHTTFYGLYVRAVPAGKNYHYGLTR